MYKYVFIPLLLCTACVQENVAPISFLGNNFYGKEATFASNGNELPKYSSENPADLPADRAEKYHASDAESEYGVVAEVKEIESITLDDIDAEQELAPVEYASAEQIEKVEEKTEEVAEDVKVVETLSKQNQEPTKSGFIWPVRGKVLQGYSPENKGINISARKGTPIRSVGGGVVKYSGDKIKSYGNLVIVAHPEGYYSAYAHADDLVVKKGDTISKGQLLGFVGDTGVAETPQLYFSLRDGSKGKQPVNPVPLLNDG